MADKLPPAGSRPTYNQTSLKDAMSRTLKQIVDTVAPQMNPRRREQQTNSAVAQAQSTDHDY